MSKISIIIPCYNTAKYLEECLESALNQDFLDLEIIAINDGSTDDTLQLLNKLSRKDDRLRVIDQENGGLTKTRNIGLDLANGDYIMFLDGDDFLEDGCLHLLYDMAKQTDADMTFADYNSYVNGVKHLSKSYISQSGIIDKDRYFKEYLLGNRAFYAVWARLFKATIFKEHNLRCLESVFMAEDLNLMTKVIFLSKKIAKINRPVYNYRIGENNASKKLSLKHFKDVRAVENDLRNFFFQLKIPKDKNGYLEAHFLIMRYNAALTVKPYSFDEYEECVRFACKDIKTAFKSSGFKFLNPKFKLLFYIYKFSFNHKIYTYFLWIKFKLLSKN